MLLEFIVDGENGILIDLFVSVVGEWVYLSSFDCGMLVFEWLFIDEVEWFVYVMLSVIWKVGGDLVGLVNMCCVVYVMICDGFDSWDVNLFWDDYYVIVM